MVLVIARWSITLFEIQTGISSYFKYMTVELYRRKVDIDVK